MLSILRRLRATKWGGTQPTTSQLDPVLLPVREQRGRPEQREVSPLLGSRSGLSTAEEPMANVAAKLAELVVL
jgi:hypothetical protein